MPRKQKISDSSGTYERIGTGADGSDSSSDSPPELAPGIGTRISAAAAEVGTRTYAAFVMGVSSDALQRYIREENQPPFAALARLCIKGGFSLDWLATGEGAEKVLDRTGAGSHSLSEEALSIALEMADRAIGQHWLPRRLYARLVRLLYDGITQGLPMADVQQIGISAARSMAQGESDDGESEVGGGGQGGDGGGSAPPLLPGQGEW